MDEDFIKELAKEDWKESNAKLYKGALEALWQKYLAAIKK